MSAPDGSTPAAAQRLARARVMAASDLTAAVEELLGALTELVAIAAAVTAGDAAHPAVSAPNPDARAARTAAAGLTTLRRWLRADDAASTHRFDREVVWHQLFDLWRRDDGGALGAVETWLLGVAASPADRRQLVALARDALAELPLVFRRDAGVALDGHRASLEAERWRMEWLIGELLAAGGNVSFATLVARGHFDHTGEAAPLVRALARDGHPREALSIAQAALANPSAAGHAEVRRLMETVVADGGNDRTAKRDLESTFLHEPTRAAFAALRAVTPPDQWRTVRARVLAHLQRHQRAPTLVFGLLLDDNQWLEADGLAVTQPVAADALIAGAERLTPHEPARAAGWLLIAAHRLAEHADESRHDDVVACLRLMATLADNAGGHAARRRALAQFRSRHEACTPLLRRLSAAGL